jgi:hypothetical protein
MRNHRDRDVDKTADSEHRLNVPSRSPSAKRGRKTRRAPRPQSLLILHLNSAKLRQDGLHLGDLAWYVGALSAYGLGSTVQIHEPTTLAEVRDTFAALATNRNPKTDPYDVIVVVGHSNEVGIQMAADHFAKWEEFAAWTKPLRPRRLLLAACRAGRFEPGDAMFAVNRDLRRIFACPVNATKDFAKLMLFAVPYVVAERTPKAKHVFATQAASIVLTGCPLREWRRTADKGRRERLVHDLIADLTAPLMRQVPATVDAFIKSVFK